MVEIIPSILVKSREEFNKKVREAERYAERVHLDVADGIFVPNMTISGFNEVEGVETSLKIEAHLMVSKPENHIVRWLETAIDRLTFHVEATKKTMEILAMVEESDCQIGLALNPQTFLEEIKPFVDNIDFIHFMTVEPGFYGGKFLDKVVEKIADFHYFYPDKPISVDGGVTPDNAPALVAAGASRLIVGSYLWHSGDFKKALEDIKSVV